MGLFRISMCLLVVLMSRAAASAADEPQTADVRPGLEVLETFSVSRNGDYLCLPVRLPKLERAALFLVDTGAETSAFDVSLKGDLGKPNGKVRLAGPQGHIEAEVFEVGQATVGELPMQGVSNVVALDLTELRRATGHDVRGILGMDFLRHHTFQVDFDGGKLTFLNVTDPAVADLGKPVRVFLFDTNTPVVAGAASLDHMDRFVVDTAATLTGVLSPKLFDELVDQGKLTKLTENKILTVSGSTRVAIGRNEFLGLKKFIVPKPVVGRGDTNYFGLGFWSRFVTTFDFPNKTIYLKKGKRFAEIDLHNWTGLSLVREDGVVKVRSVNSNSPASAAGIEISDRLLKLADVPAEGLSLFEIRRQMMLRSERLRITIAQKGKPRTVVLTAKPTESSIVPPAPPAED